MGFSADFESAWLNAGCASRVGDSVTYTPGAYPPNSSHTITVSAVIRMKYANDDGVEMAYTAAVMPITVVAAPKEGDWIGYSGASYKVRGVQSDGVGHNVLVLEKQ